MEESVFYDHMPESSKLNPFKDIKPVSEFYVYRLLYLEWQLFFR
jgi:hypothetical protein